MRNVFPCLIALVLASAPATRAQQAAPADSQPVVVAQNQRRPAPVATPIPQEEPKKRGMLQRIFGTGREKATPAPRPAATPEKATPTPRPQRSTATTSRRAKPDAGEDDDKPAPAKVEKKEETPAVAKKTTKPKPKVKDDDEDEKKESGEPAPEEKLTAEQQAVKDAEAAGNPIAIEKAKYDEVKSRAIQDEKIVALKEKADAATDEEEGRKALRAYNKALFQKMRSLDSSIRERVDLMEEAVMKRLEPTTAAKK